MRQTSIRDMAAIDVHGHYGNYVGKINALQDRLMSGSAEEVAERAAIANTRFTIVSPIEALLPQFEANAVSGNIDAARKVEQHSDLLQWVVVHPLQQETYRQADEMLDHPKCVGIKIHPEMHGYPIKQFGEELFSFAAARKAIVLTHSGEQNSLPGDFVEFTDRYADVRLILAHLGLGWDDDYSHHVRAIQSGRNGNLYVDTSSANSVVSNLIEWAVEEVGAERILYGSDTPLYSAAMQRARIDSAQIGDDEKRLILFDNAARLFGIKGDDRQ